MVIDFKRYSFECVLDMLKEMSPQFSPALSDSLDLNAYAEKLAKNATFLTYSESSKLEGVIVFYPNKLTLILYIPLVWVEKNCRGRGIAKLMFDHLIRYSKQDGFSYIDLEVLKNNIAANQLYRSLGFSNKEDRKDKYLLRYVSQ